MKLRTEISSILILKSLIFVFVCSLIFYNYVKKGFVEQIQDRLISVAEHKKNSFESFLQKRLEEVNHLKSLSVIKENLYHFQTTGNEEYLAPLNEALFQSAVSFSSIRHIHITNKDKLIITSSDSTKIGKKHIDYEVPIVPKHRGENDDELIIKLSSPMYHNGVKTGTMWVEFIADELKTIAKDYLGLGETGETILAAYNIEGEPIYLIMPRFNTPEKSREIDTEVDQLTFLALEGKQGFYEGIHDYRGEKVLAVTRYLQPSGWALVTKIDMDEGLSTLTFIRRLTFWIASITSLLLIIIAFIIADYLVKPIVRITNTAVKISEGDYSKRVKVGRKNELGTLAESFNVMTDKLMDARKGLEQKVDELNLSNDSLNRFAYIVSHDLKAPLHSITGLSDILKDEYRDKLDEQGIMMFEMMQSKVHLMQQLIDGILKYSRMGNCLGNDEHVDLNQVLKDVFENTDSRKNIKFEKTGQFPTLFTNKTCIIQIFQNLINNSVKYMNKEEGKVEVGYVAESEFHKFYVSDNGPGIPAKYHDKIFEIFNTGGLADNTSSTGVGLAIVKRIIDAYKGKIWIESIPGEGATFYFTLPKE